MHPQISMFAHIYLYGLNACIKTWSGWCSYLVICKTQRIEIQFTVCMSKGPKILPPGPALSAAIMKVGLLLRIEPSGFPMGSWILTWVSLNPNVKMMQLKRINSRFPGPSYPVTPPHKHVKSDKVEHCYNPTPHVIRPRREIPNSKHKDSIHSFGH